MLSAGRMETPQRGHRERGWMRDSWRGRREMQTLRKLPKASPKRTTKIEISTTGTPEAMSRIAVSPCSDSIRGSELGTVVQ